MSFHIHAHDARTDLDSQLEKQCIVELPILLRKKKPSPDSLIKSQDGHVGVLCFQCMYNHIYIYICIYIYILALYNLR